MRPEAIRVGELAKRTGVSVRTLHYYEEMACSRHRGAATRGIGSMPTPMSSACSRSCCSGTSASLWKVSGIACTGTTCRSSRVIEMHLAGLREQIALQGQLCDRLEAIARGLQMAEQPSVADLLHTMEVMNRVEKYYTPEQQEWLKERRQTISDERIHEVEAEWPRLMAEVGAAIDAGIDPRDPHVQALAARWHGLVQEFTGGNPGIEKSLRTMYENERPQDLHSSIHPGALRSTWRISARQLRRAKPSSSLTPFRFRSRLSRYL